MRTTFAFAMLVAVVATIPGGAEAQWTAGNYTVDTVVENTGNYTYRPTGSSPGYVKAMPHATLQTRINVKYSRTYTAPSGTPNFDAYPGMQVDRHVCVWWSYLQQFRSPGQRLTYPDGHRWEQLQRNIHV